MLKWLVTWREMKGTTWLHPGGPQSLPPPLTRIVTSNSFKDFKVLSIVGVGFMEARVLDFFEGEFFNNNPNIYD
jgi:hypothetical protein